MINIQDAPASREEVFEKYLNFPCSCFAWMAFIRVYDTWKSAKYHVCGKGPTQQHGAIKCFLNATMPSFGIQNFFFCILSQNKIFLVGKIHHLYPRGCRVCIDTPQCQILPDYTKENDKENISRTDLHPECYGFQENVKWKWLFKGF